MKEKGDEIIGKRVIIKSCEAGEHGDNSGCVCDLIGETVTIKKKYNTPYAGEPSYYIKGSNKRVRRSEVRLPREGKTGKDRGGFVLYGIEHGCSPTTRELLSVDVRTKKGEFVRAFIAIEGGNILVRTYQEGMKKEETKIPIPCW